MIDSIPLLTWQAVVNCLNFHAFHPSLFSLKSALWNTYAIVDPLLIPDEMRWLSSYPGPLRQLRVLLSVANQWLLELQRWDCRRTQLPELEWKLHGNLHQCHYCCIRLKQCRNDPRGIYCEGWLLSQNCSPDAQKNSWRLWHQYHQSDTKEQSTILKWIEHLSESTIFICGLW